LIIFYLALFLAALAAGLWWVSHRNQANIPAAILADQKDTN